MWSWLWSVEPACRMRLACYTQVGGNWLALRAVEDREYRSLIHAELGFKAHGGRAPEWLPQRSHDQSNAAVEGRPCW